MRYLIIFVTVSTWLMLWYSEETLLLEKSVSSVFLYDIDEETIPQMGCDTTYGMEEPHQLVVEVCQALFTDCPSHSLFNRLLKKLYSCSDDHPDLFNLRGRLFWYKLHLEQQQQIYSEDWVERWKSHALKSWQRAVELYAKRRSFLYLYIQDWMPEKSLFSKEYTHDQQKRDMKFLIEHVEKIF